MDFVLGLGRESLTIRWGLDDVELDKRGENGAGGIFDQDINVIKMHSNQNSIETILHEFCHTIDWNIGIESYYSFSNYQSTSYFMDSKGQWSYLPYGFSQAGFSVQDPREDFADSLLVMILNANLQAIPSLYSIPDINRQYDILKGYPH
jgi:hypothetical protein